MSASPTRASSSSAPATTSTSAPQRGGPPLIEHTLAAICEIFPIFRPDAGCLEMGGIVDVTPDRSAIIGKTPVRAFTSTGGWGMAGS